MSGDSTGVILVAVDGSRNSLVAAAAGARLANMLHAHLGLVHVLVVPPLNFWTGVENRMKEDIRAQAEQTLTDVSHRIASFCDLIPNFYIVEGPPEEEICRLAREDPNVLMIVVGRLGVDTEKGSRLTRPDSGGIVNKLAKLSPVPLLLIPPDVESARFCPNLAEFMSQDQPI
jgi:nucleotide-binding universal stress UspA family protein